MSKCDSTCTDCDGNHFMDARDDAGRDIVIMLGADGEPCTTCGGCGKVCRWCGGQLDGAVCLGCKSWDHERAAFATREAFQADADLWLAMTSAEHEFPAVYAIDALRCHLLRVRASA